MATGDLAVVEVTVANGGTTSNAFDARGHAITGVELPAALTSTALTFEVARALAGAYKALEDDAGNPVAMVVAADKVVAPASEDAPALFGLPFVKLVLGSAEGAERKLWVYLR
jgi:hypothetical protein